MRLGRLTALEEKKLKMNIKNLEKIKYYKDVLANEFMVLNIIKMN